MTPENQAPGLGQGTTEDCRGVHGRGRRQGRHGGYCPRMVFPDLRELLPRFSTSARQSSPGPCSRPTAWWAADPTPGAGRLCPRAPHGAWGARQDLSFQSRAEVTAWAPANSQGPELQRPQL